MIKIETVPTLLTYEGEALRCFSGPEVYEETQISPEGCVTLVAALGLAGEAGEVVDIIKKEYFHNKPLDRDALVGELGDTLCYLVALGHQYGFTLTDMMEANLKKLRKRYPSGFNFEDANNRRDETRAKIPNPDCVYCHGTGEYYAHSEDCRNDHCALAAGPDDCNGIVSKCNCG